jgi:two-component system phosphate regulon response regulator OmpR
MNDEPAHILVVDDDTRLRQLLSRYLQDQGFRVTTAADAADARRKLDSLAFDLLVLDIMMPGESGLDLTTSLRRDSDVPILLLTAMNESEDRIHGFLSGADDYLAKPFEPRELVLRIQSILRRIPMAVDEEEESHLRNFGEFQFDLERCELRRDDSFVRLSDAEAKLLEALARRAGESVSREDLADELGVGNNPRTVDVQMARLRRKIERDPKYPRHLRTVRGVGYVLVTDR